MFFSLSSSLLFVRKHERCVFITANAPKITSHLLSKQHKLALYTFMCSLLSVERIKFSPCFTNPYMNRFFVFLFSNILLFRFGFWCFFSVSAFKKVHLVNFSLYFRNWYALYRFVLIRCRYTFMKISEILLNRLAVWFDSTETRTQVGVLLHFLTICRDLHTGHDRLA